MSLPASHPVLTCAEARAWEKARLTDESLEWSAMQEAGAKVALSVLDDYKEIGGLPVHGRILVLAGKGHNGGDALLAARAILYERPDTRAVVVLAFGAGELRPLAGRALDWLREQAPERVQILPAGQALAADQEYALCLDGIFGFQFRPPMDAAVARLLAQVNTHDGIRFRAAVDLPSGVGENSASVPFRADFTYATGSVKYPVLLPRNNAVVGRLRYVDIGLLQEASAPDATERILIEQLLKPLVELRPAQSDKRTFGHLLVVGGSHSYPGAVIMAARAALRSGTGLVTAFVPEKFAPEYAARHPEVMWVGCPVTAAGGLAAGTAELVQARAAKGTAMLVGPGMGAEAETLGLAAHLVGEAKVPLVLDADALRPEVVARVLSKPFIGTPHAGEFERIAPALFTDGNFTAPQGVLVLKGPLTRVTDGKKIYHSPFGGPVLARGGSGDILAGLIGGLLAQAPGDHGLAACRGVVWHGRAADLLARAYGQVTVETSEILEQLGPALKPTPWQTH
ncbi:NAD(P)H-hydrate dehydratase [Opitutus sp. GAS368]|uniref:NAD(P)H-hydrate dehydratase n=1 Tax=Opitutus sp. GAS368 TaxID=1882749 RepID=UPI00087B3C01|nr:NAD(P)H-hydrate dehydratase [Opitutus sp. GAS368]SDR77106.1 NAD(P)H-hydrate epimerase [Opitutus sp. GAS368]